jgi:broad specificity phosphatase PhoE
MAKKTKRRKNRLSKRYSKKRLSRKRLSRKRYSKKLSRKKRYSKKLSRKKRVSREMKGGMDATLSGGTAEDLVNAAAFGLKVSEYLRLKAEQMKNPGRQQRRKAKTGEPAPAPATLEPAPAPATLEPAPAPSDDASQAAELDMTLEDYLATRDAYVALRAKQAEAGKAGSLSKQERDTVITFARESGQNAEAIEDAIIATAAASATLEAEASAEADTAGVVESAMAAEVAAHDQKMVGVHGGGIQYGDIPDGQEIQRILGDGNCFYYAALCLTKIARNQTGCRAPGGTACSSDKEIRILRNQVATWIETNILENVRGGFPYNALAEISQNGSNEDFQVDPANTIKKYIEGVRWPEALTEEDAQYTTNVLRYGGQYAGNLEILITCKILNINIEIIMAKLVRSPDGSFFYSIETGATEVYGPNMDGRQGTGGTHTIRVVNTGSQEAGGEGGIPHYDGLIPGGGGDGGGGAGGAVAVASAPPAHLVAGSASMGYADHSGGVAGGENWHCSSCTFLNDQLNENCEMCGESRIIAPEPAPMGAPEPAPMGASEPAPMGAPEPAPMGALGTIKIGLIRHSVREDNEPTGQEWQDRGERPYDPPISFKHPYTSTEDLPKEKAIELQEYNFTRIISSPFRRCLQTAAIIASDLGIGTIDVNKGIGEVMTMVSRVGGTPGNFKYLSPEQMDEIIQEASGGLANIGKVYGDNFEFRQDDVAVIRKNFGIIKEEILGNPERQNVLLVTHGDVIGQTLNIVNGETLIECDYCKWIIYKEDHLLLSKLKLLAKNDGIESF